MYYVVQMEWDGQVRLPGLRGTVWYVPWDPSVPHGTDGMGWTSATTWRGTVWYVPWDPSVPRGTEGKVRLPGLRGTVWYVPWDPSVPRGTEGMGWTSGTTWLKGYCMVHPMGSQCTTWYRRDGMDKWDYLA